MSTRGPNGTPAELLAGSLVAAARAHARGHRTAAAACAAELGRGRFAGRPRTVGVAAGIALGTLVGELWEAGWLPEDLWQVVRRRAGPEQVSLLVDTIAADTARHAAAAVPQRWLAQVRGLEAAVWWEHDRPHLPQWAHREGVSLEHAVLVAIGLLSELVLLPSLPRILSPPGTGQPVPSATGAAGVDPKILARVRALLAKAESTSFPEEADALSAKAQELMNRHAFERALLDAGPHAGRPATSTRVWLDSPYVDAKSHLVAAIAKANRCRSVFYSGLGFVALVGEELDLEITELLATSLLVQATRAMVAEGGRGTRTAASRTRSFRRAFLVSYAVRIGERLTEAAEQAREPVADPRLLPVLAARSQAVEETFEAMFGHVVRKSTSVSNGEGWQAGRAAADRAELAVRRRELGMGAPVTDR